MSPFAVQAAGLCKEYRAGDRIIRAIDDVSFEIEGGSFVSIMGPSGSGKSTLLHLIGALDTATGGSMVVDGRDLGAMNDEELTEFRRKRLGFVFQFFNLLPTLRAWENVALPLMLDGFSLDAARPSVMKLLDKVGLSERAEHRPAQLSGGEMQRVAIARSLAADPVLILADEPTGNLDSASGQKVLDLLKSLVSDEGKTLVMVTHDSAAASAAGRILQLEDGRLC